MIADPMGTILSNVALTGIFPGVFVRKNGQAGKNPRSWRQSFFRKMYANVEWLQYR